MKRAVDVVTILAIVVVGVWVVATNASDGGEVVLYSLVVLAAVGLIAGTRVATERLRRRSEESGRKQSRHAWLFFLVLGPPLAGYGAWLLTQPHSDEAGGRWPFGTTSLGVVSLGIGLSVFVYAFIMRAQRDRN